MKKAIIISLVLLMLPAILHAVKGKPVPKATPTDTLPGDTIWYDGVDFTFYFVAPQGWVTDLDNAFFDGYTAAMFPAEESYFNATKQILVWVLDLDSLSFRRFVTLDSLHLKRSKDIAFKDRYPLNDPLYQQKKNEARFGVSKAIDLDTTQLDSSAVLELYDPGGKTPEAMIAYFNAGSEIVLFQLNISERFHVGLAEIAFLKVLKSFTLLK